jgi:polysaccharide export outer membrane protein
MRNQLSGSVRNHLGDRMPNRYLQLPLLFFCVASTVFCAAALAQQNANPANMPIVPGDRIRITMREDPDVNYIGPVSAAGTIPIPYLGEFAISGYSPEQAEKALAAELTGELYEQATVTVTMVKKALGQVYVYGAVKQPGVVEIPDVGGLTVLQLVARIGGLSRWAAPEDAFIIRRSRPGEPAEQIDLNLEEIFETAIPNTESDVMLQANDVVCIPGISGGLFDFLSVDEAEVFVVGEVQSEEVIVRFAPGERRTLFRAILKAGGFTDFARSKDVRIVSYDKDGNRREQTVDASKIVEEGYLDQDVELDQGDMVIVPQKRFSL